MAAGTPSNPPETPELRPDMTPAERYRVTLDGIGHSAGLIASEARSVGQTIDALNEAFAGVIGDGDRESFGGFGLIGLPLMATWAAIKKAAEQYVGQRTGQSLKDWMTFVEAASEQFDEYILVLESLQRFAVARDEAETRETDHGDRERLSDVRHTTQAWKVILDRVARIGHLVDAMLAAQTAEETVVEDPAPDNRSKWASKLQDKVTEAVSQTSLGTAELREWLFRPLVELRDQVQELPAAVARLGEEVAMLEVKLELAIAQLEVRSGTITDDDVGVMQLRVAGTVLLPGLIAELERVEGEREERQRHRTRLQELHAAGEIGDAVRDRLDETYAAELDLVDRQLAGLTDQMAAWRTEGPDAIAACLSWIDAELELLRGRRLVEQEEHIEDRIELLETERRRLVSVQQFLDGSGR